MLKDKSSSAILAVSDLARARRFYGETLDLPLVQESEQVLVLRTGLTQLVVYVSGEAGSNRANAVVWGLGEDFDAILDDLRRRDVTFEHYPETGMDYADGVHRSGIFRAAWFKDPDGNILHVNNM